VFVSEPHAVARTVRPSRSAIRTRRDTARP
jgi:hypothetical protein